MAAFLGGTAGDVDLTVAGAVAGVAGVGVDTAGDAGAGGNAAGTGVDSATDAGADVAEAGGDSTADAAAGVGVDTAAGVAAAGRGAGVAGGDGASVAAAAGAADSGAVATAAVEDAVEDEFVEDGAVDCCDEALVSDAGGGTASCLVVAGSTEPGTCALTIELINSVQVNAKMKRGRRWLMMSSRIASAVHFDYYFEKLAP